MRTVGLTFESEIKKDAEIKKDKKKRAEKDTKE